MKIFHSMPLAGKTDADIESARNWQHEAAKVAAARHFGVSVDDCEILSTFINETPGKDYKTQALWYMGKGIMEHLARADVLVMSPDYASARGCRVERIVAEAYDVPVLVLEEQ